MTMRIDGQHQPLDAEAARRAEGAAPTDRASGAGSARQAPTGDRVEVSADAQLVAAALRAADEAPGIRPEAVARAREALDNGTLGADTTRLADRMINALLSE